MTGDDGTFSLAVPPGSYTLQATFIGYQAVKQSVEVSAGRRQLLIFSLNPSPVALGEEFVVVGSRTVRTAIETPAPVDVISELEIRHLAKPKSTRRCANWLPPSMPHIRRFPTAPITSTQPACAALGPDQVLVLINGKRRHSSALVHVNGTFGRGTVGVDLNSIPKAAVERIEILRDGAAAPVRLGRHRRSDQYRSQRQHRRHPTQQRGRHYGRRATAISQDRCELRLRG